MAISQRYALELGRQVDELEAENERLRRERDAARARCDTLSLQVLTLTNERDEARARVAP
jgi:hypothetical protein